MTITSTLEDGRKGTRRIIDGFLGSSIVDVGRMTIAWVGEIIRDEIFTLENDGHPPSHPCSLGNENRSWLHALELCMEAVPLGELVTHLYPG